MSVKAPNHEIRERLEQLKGRAEWLLESTGDQDLLLLYEILDELERRLYNLEQGS